MKVRDILKGASVILSKHDLTSKLASEEEIVSSEVDMLLVATNLILEEIACDYIPCYKIEEIVVRDNKYSISELSESLLAIRSIKDGKMQSVSHFVNGDYIVLPNGKFTIKYTYLPKRVNIDSDIIGFDRQLTDRVIIYGVVSEYYLMSGLYSEAELMRGKFESAITSASKKLTNIVMRGRVWA